MKLTSLAVAALLAFPMVAQAQRTEPNKPTPNRDRAERNEKPLGGGRKGEGFMPGRQPTQQEIEETLTYVKENFPNHYEGFSRLPANGPLRRAAENKMTLRYRQLMRMEDQNPEAYQALLRQFKFEDDALGLARDIRAGKDGAEDRLEKVVRDMIKQTLEDRKERIEKLRKALEEQEEKLEEDEKNSDRLVSQQVDRAKMEYDRLFRGRDGRGANPEKDAGQQINANKK